jgi:hypothetical protein
MRFGLTGAIDDQSAPGKLESGPAIGLGLRAGPFVGEVEWAYLSFFDPDTSNYGVHRVGLAQSVWLEGGFGERLGQWHLDSQHIAPASSRVPEAHLSIGVEIDNQIQPMRNGFQLGVRFAVAPRGTDPMSTCRSSGECTATPTSDLSNNGGLDASVLVEWMFLFGAS